MYGSRLATTTSRAGPRRSRTTLSRRSRVQVMGGSSRVERRLGRDQDSPTDECRVGAVSGESGFVLETGVEANVGTGGARTRRTPGVGDLSVLNDPLGANPVPEPAS